MPEPVVERRAATDEPIFRSLDAITAAFVAVLLVSNVASTKIVELGRFEFDGGTLLFPLSYLFGDVLTEVYGFRRARRVIWLGFAAIAIAAGVFALVDALPPAPGYAFADAYHLILGQTPRIVAGSLVGYWCGAFANSIVLARLKLRTGGRHFWLRAIASTAVGQAIDTVVFLGIAFAGVLPWELLQVVFVSNYVFKVGLEMLLTPATYLVVNGLKRWEGVDAFDHRTTFNPFAISGR